MDGIAAFQQTLPVMGPGGVTLLRRAGLLSDLDAGLLDAIRSKCRITFRDREFSLREAVGRGFDMVGFGDEAGGAVTRDLIAYGLAVSVYVALTDRPEEFGIRTAPDGAVYFTARL